MSQLLECGAKYVLDDGETTGWGEDQALGSDRAIGHIRRRPVQLSWLHRLLTRVLPFPGWCFLNLFVLRKRPPSERSAAS